MFPAAVSSICAEANSLAANTLLDPPPKGDKTQKGAS